MKKILKFAELGLSDELMLALSKKGFEEPTPIQEKCIPFIFSKDVDIIGQAQTGTGKTAAFGLPILDLINENSKNIQVIILTPTRELAIQISEELHSFIGNKKIKITPIYGGQSISLQLRMLSKGVDIIVGTPGRVIDHLYRKTLDLSKISFLVIDEADEMLNMGFIEDIEKIITHTNSNRKTFLFSATMPPKIKELAKKYMKNVELLSVKNKHLTADLTEQIYFEINRQDKFEALCRIIDIEEDFYSIIFCHTRNDVNQLTTSLLERGYDVDCLHGEISQVQRERTLTQFKNKRINILIATDVAARGIDINDLTHVINYSLPQNSETYIHRIGRTGRAGKKGKAITFITPFEYKKLFRIQTITKAEIKKESIPKITQIVKTKKNKLIEDINTIIESKENLNFVKFSKLLLEKYSSQELVSALLKQFIQNEWDEDNYPEIKDEFINKKGKSRLFIAKGKDEKYTPKKLIKLIRSKVNISDRKIKDIKIYENFSFVTVPFLEAELIVEAFSQEKRKKPLIELAKDKKKNRSKNLKDFSTKSNK